MLTSSNDDLLKSTNNTQEEVSENYNSLNQNDEVKSQSYHKLSRNLLLSIRSASSLQQLANIADMLLEIVTKELFVECFDHNDVHACYDNKVKSIKGNSYELCCFNLLALLISALSRQIIRIYTHLVPTSLYVEPFISKSIYVEASTAAITNTDISSSNTATKNCNEVDDECFQAIMTRVLDNMLETRQKHYCQNYVKTFDCRNTNMHLIFTILTRLEHYMNKLQEEEAVYRSSLYVTGELQDLRKWLKQQCVFLLTKHIHRMSWNVTDVMFIIADLTEIVEDNQSIFHTEVNANMCSYLCVKQLNDSKDKKMKETDDCSAYVSNEQELDEHREEEEENEEQEQEIPLQVTELITPLRDPISQRVIHIPARGKYCTHLELFDLESFVRLVEQRVRQSECSRESCGCKCPFCNQYILLVDVRVDELVLRALVEYGLYTYNRSNTITDVCDEEHNNGQITFNTVERIEEQKKKNVKSNIDHGLLELCSSKWSEILCHMHDEELTLNWNVQKHIVKVEKTTKRRNASRSTSRSVGDTFDEHDNIVDDEEEWKNPHNNINETKNDEYIAAITSQSTNEECKDKTVEDVSIILSERKDLSTHTTHNDSKKSTSRLKVHEMSAKRKKRRIEIGNTVMYVDEE